MEFPKANFTNKKRVICEVLREIYDVLDTTGGFLREPDRDKLVALLTEANTMAKKMQNKLYEYKYNVSEHAAENTNYESSRALREGRDVHS